MPIAAAAAGARGTRFFHTAPWALGIVALAFVTVSYFAHGDRVDVGTAVMLGWLFVIVPAVTSAAVVVYVAVAVTT